MKDFFNWSVFKDYFFVMKDKEDEQETIDNICKGISFRGANLWILIFAIFIASLGLNVNSPAVIIGAMLISPLMGPIIGIGLAIGINDFEILKKSFKNYFVAVIISVLTATVYFLISPFNEAQPELLARTSPTLYDVLIAFCGGAAGIVAICTKGKGNVLPGVAIATALMPPLCTAGYGIATGHLFYFLGAFYLFFINSVFICLATYLGIRMLHFEHRQTLNPVRYKKVRQSIVIIVILTMIPAGIITCNIVRDSILKNKINNFITAELNQKGTQIIDHNLQKSSLTLRVVAVGKTISIADIHKKQMLMSKYNLGKYKLQIIQGTQTDSLLMLKNQMNKLADKKSNYNQVLQEQSQRINTLENELSQYTYYEQLSTKLQGQIKVLFPKITTFGISRFNEMTADSTNSRKYVIAFVGFNKKQKPTAQEMSKLYDWLKLYSGSDSLRIVTSQP